MMVNRPSGSKSSARTSGTSAQRELSTPVVAGVIAAAVLLIVLAGWFFFIRDNTPRPINKEGLGIGQNVVVPGMDDGPAQPNAAGSSGASGSPSSSPGSQ